MVWLAAAAAASDVIGEETHLELEVGFLLGDRGLGAVPFEQVGAGRPLAGLDASFAAHPLSDALVTGPRAEVRLVAPPLRASLGWQRPYPDWQIVPEARDVDGDGRAVISEVRALRTDEWVLGIGVEAAAAVDLREHVRLALIEVVLRPVAAALHEGDGVPALGERVPDGGPAAAGADDHHVRGLHRVSGEVGAHADHRALRRASRSAR